MHWTQPGAPHNIILGHIPSMAKEAQKFPLDAHDHVLLNHFADQYHLRQYGLFYVDVYPVQRDPLLVVISPEVAAQVSQITSYPKHPSMVRDFGRAFGPRGMSAQEGTDWKELRTIFNPGFSQANLFSMVPMMVDETEVFASRLSGLARAGGFVRSLESLAADLTVDVIGQALFGLKFNSQTSSNAMIAAIMEASRLTRPLSDLSPERLNLWRTLKLRYYELVSNRSIDKLLRVKWSELAFLPEKLAYSNSILDIAMVKYMKKGGTLGDHVAKDFLELMRQVLNFLHITFCSV
jgi:cytochrome P450